MKLSCAALLVLLCSVPVAGQTSETASEPSPAGGSPPPATPQDVPDGPSVFGIRDGRPSLRFGRLLRIDFRLKLQGDFRSFSAEEPADADTFEMNRRRVGIRGTFLRHFEYEVERELREQNVWRDAFVNFTYLDDFQLQAGKFKVPFSQEQLTSPTDLDFVYRTQLVDSLSPARSVGVVLHGRFARRAVGYDAGVFREDGENARFGFNPGAERTIAARFAARPLRLTSAPGATREMEVAVAITAGDVPEGLNSLRGRTTFRMPFFEPVYVKGQRLRLGVDADWRPGPFSIKAEIIRVSDERKNQGLFDEDLPPLVAQGWYLSGTWAITGESKFEGFAPRRPLLRGGAGAIELAARYERLQFGSSFDEEPDFIHPRAANLTETSDGAWTFGINWYVNRWVKLQVNAIREWVENTNSISIQNRTALWTRVARLQFVM